VYASGDNLASELGSDFFTGGGFVEEVLIDWSTTTAGEAAAGTVKFTPDRTLMEGDAVTIPLGLPGIVTDVLGGTSTCTPTGASSTLFTVNITVATSTVILTVAAGKTVPRAVPVELVLPVTCKIYNPLLTGAAGAYKTATGTNAVAGYGTATASGTTPTLPTLVMAPVLSADNTISKKASGRFDNCLGTGCNAFSGISHFALRTIQDASSMDTVWNGTLRYSSQGTRCSSSPSTAAGPFPSTRFCTSFGNGFVSNNGAGDNGAPIGSNPNGPALGTNFLQNNDRCRRHGISTNNPCALTIGSDWTVGLSSLDVGATYVSFKFAYAKAIRSGSTLKFRLPSNASTNSTLTVDAKIFDSDTQTQGSAITTWTAAYEQETDRGIMTLTIKTNVPAGHVVSCNVTGMNATMTSTPKGVVGEVSQGAKTTLIFRHGGVQANYKSAEGAPLQTYAEQPLPFEIIEGKIYSFRVYAYNGRFLSDPTVTTVNNRAISPPKGAAYIPQVSVDSMGVAIDCNTSSSVATQIKLTFTPRIPLSGGMQISLALPGFSVNTTISKSDFVPLTAAASQIKTGAGAAETKLTTGSWTTNTSMLVFVVATDQIIPANAEYSVTVTSSVGLITAPSSYVIPTFQLANITALRMDLTSAFPRKSQPRQGFVAQFSTDSTFVNDVQTVTVPDTLNAGLVELQVTPVFLCMYAFVCVCLCLSVSVCPRHSECGLGRAAGDPCFLCMYAFVCVCLCLSVPDTLNAGLVEL
jgi:hypothetical protein